MVGFSQLWFVWLGGINRLLLGGGQYCTHHPTTTAYKLRSSVELQTKEMRTMAKYGLSRSQKYWKTNLYSKVLFHKTMSSFKRCLPSKDSSVKGHTQSYHWILFKTFKIIKTCTSFDFYQVGQKLFHLKHLVLSYLISYY